MKSFLHKWHSIAALMLVCSLLLACNKASKPSNNIPSTTADTIMADTAMVMNTMTDDEAKGREDWEMLTATDIQEDSVLQDGSVPCSWAEAGIKQPQSLKLFLKKIQYWLSEGGKDSIVQVILYPIDIQKHNYADAAALLKDYDKVFTPKTIAAIAAQTTNNINRGPTGANINKVLRLKSIGLNAKKQEEYRISVIRPIK